jgi:hypothetical protein
MKVCLVIGASAAPSLWVGAVEGSTKRCLVKLAKHTSSSFWLHQSLPLVMARATMYSLTVKGSCFSSISNNVQTCATLAEDDCSIVYIEAPRVKITTMDVTVEARHMYVPCPNIKRKMHLITQ